MKKSHLDASLTDLKGLIIRKDQVGCENGKS